MNYIILVTIGYLIGIIPVSYLVGKRMGNLDVRKHGSGNAGATNILRTVGKKAALIALNWRYNKRCYTSNYWWHNSRNFWSNDLFILSSYRTLLSYNTWI